MNKIILNGEDFEVNSNLLPMLIHGESKSGASLFTITVAANLFLRGEKLFFLSGYEMARDEFYKQIGKDSENNVLFFTSAEQEKFHEIVLESSDLKERVVIIKNIELFSEYVLKLLSKCNKIIISGDIGKSILKQDILRNPFKSKVIFTKIPEIQTPTLNKYEGYLINESNKGIISTSINSFL